MADGTLSTNAKVPVTFERIEKAFGTVRVLEELNLAIEPGEFLVLLGASGSGKTTALRILSGLETATSGRVLIGERDVTDILPKYRDISMVFQSYALYPHKTVAENIGFPLKVRRVPRAEQDAAIRDAANFKSLYLNGVLDNSGAGVGQALLTTLSVGALVGGGREFPGSVGDLLVYDRALDASLVAWRATEPYAFLRPIIRRRYFVPAAADAVSPLRTLLGVGR